jgi:hydroxymethylpyrimidine pyrophosphatase-like HAD family hydrolase
MMPMPIKLLIADVDGTMLTKGKVLTDRTREAVARMRAAGVEFTIVSGRPPRGMAKLVAALSLTMPVAAFNGGVYVQTDLRTVVAQRLLPPDAVRETMDYLLQAGLDVWIYRGGDWFLRNADAFRVAHERSNVGFDPVVIRDLHGVLDAVHQDRRRQRGSSPCRTLRGRAEGAAGRPHVSGALDRLLPRRHSPRGEQGHGGA